MGFTHSDSGDPHVQRRRDILRDHPDVKELFGREPKTALYILLLVAVQISAAVMLNQASWWVILLAAYTIGAFSTHALFTLKHECTHNLVLKNKKLNYMLGLIGNLPSCTPTFASFTTFHLKHHAHQGEYEMDADLPHKWEAKLIEYTPFGKILWLLLHPIVISLRPLRFDRIPYVDARFYLNILLAVAFDVAIIYWVGIPAFIYLLLSTFFALGLHPLGARWIQEHYVVAPPQETYSYYGPLNALTFNIGYHNEHHDFPGIPWSRLPKLKEKASEYYDSLYYHTSWTKLLYLFFTRADLTLFSRIERDPKRSKHKSKSQAA
ncbi:fatty acid desaturase [Balneola vulgaris]|uniref:fatty acid desaturase n=1 Tax=Balneola vulgaris TaxID=287535 RepID=UPI0003763798|nr:fatty acid desaturase [Balneola vulgaris]